MTAEALVTDAAQPTVQPTVQPPVRPEVQPRGLGRWLALEAGLGALALAAASLTNAEVRPAILWGVGSALLAGFIALPSVHHGLSKGMKGLLAGLTVGFLARVVLVALGLVLSGARGAAALPYVFAFFLLYAATQGVEIASVIQHNARSRGAIESK